MDFSITEEGVRQSVFQELDEWLELLDIELSEKLKSKIVSVEAFCIGFAFLCSFMMYGALAAVMKWQEASASSDLNLH